MTRDNVAMGPGAEFDVIRTLLEVWGPLAQGIGDDAAILTPPAGQQLVISTDTTVEDVHFRRPWLSARDIGARAATAALSDIAAMGARADSILVSFVTPTDWRGELRELAAGIGQSASAAGAKVVGGNMSRGAAFSCTLTVLGYTNTPVRRSGASAGDDLYVTGVLGGPQAAVSAFEREAAPADWALDRFLHPTARLDQGLWLAQNGALAMIDISDGLARDAEHLAAASNAAVSLEPDLIPRFAPVSVHDALEGGEEYELLVALPSIEGAQVAASFTSLFALPLTRVGSLVERNSNRRVELPGGHDHFS